MNYYTPVLQKKEVRQKGVKSLVPKPTQNEQQGQDHGHTRGGSQAPYNVHVRCLQLPIVPIFHLPSAYSTDVISSLNFLENSSDHSMFLSEYF